ncbi:glycosyltransferase [Aquimarina celericrescens]|nr:glycosyltransferase [Aquimarina celericrescens]
MKILYLTNQFYLHGGIEKILSQKINYLLDAGYEVVLCTSEHQNREYVYPLNKRLKHIDLKVDYIRNKSYFHPKNLIKSWVHFRRLKKIIHHEQPDVIISVNYTPEQYFIPFIEKKIPKVKEFHSSGDTLYFKNNLIGMLKKQLFSLFNYYHCLVVLNPDEIKYYPFSNIKVIPNFINLEKGFKIEPTKQKIILAGGRIAPVKQFDHLIAVWARIGSYFPDWQVKIFGEGDVILTNELKHQINSLKVNNIQLMGSTNQLDKEMQDASVYAMTSANECFPMVLLEAQAAAISIIAYDCPNGPRNILENDLSGILTQPNSIPDFAASLKRLLKDENLRLEMGARAVKQVKQFSPENVMGMWEDLFKDLNK